MKSRHLFLLAILLVLNCPKRFALKVEKIETIYLSSLYHDMYREKPLLAGIKDVPGIKIGHLQTDPPFMGILLGKLGFYQLLNETGLDFIIGDTPIFWTDDMRYFFIPISMGYAIKNYDGIRFAILSQDRDSLTVSDRIKMSLIQQRSDVLWIIDSNVINSPSMKINFFIKNRILSDTTITPIAIEPDSVLLKKLQDFKSMLDELLAQKIDLEGKKLGEYVLSKAALHEDANVILYPADLFNENIEKDSVSLRGILKNVMCELKFTKINIDREKILEMSRNKEYRIWGNMTGTNQVLMPDDEGEYFFDLFYPVKLQIDY